MSKRHCKNTKNYLFVQNYFPYFTFFLPVSNERLRNIKEITLFFLFASYQIFTSSSFNRSSRAGIQSELEGTKRVCIPTFSAASVFFLLSSMKRHSSAFICSISNAFEENASVWLADSHLITEEKRVEEVGDRATFWCECFALGVRHDEGIGVAEQTKMKIPM